MKDIISPDQLIESVGKLTFDEINKLRFLLHQIENIIEHPEITEDRLKDITNIKAEVDILREIYVGRLIYLYKRGFKVV